VTFAVDLDDDVPYSGATPLVAGVVAVLIGTVEFSLREHRSAYRSHTIVLALLPTGMTNRELAAHLYVSENTVKTHSSRVFDKLGAKRRTQAVQLGKQFGLLP